MKHLFLLRHAKAGWDDPALADRDRPLALRGRRAARCGGSSTSGYQYLAGVAAAALGTMSPNSPERPARRVRGKGVRDRRLLEAIASVPRAGFVPAAHSERAYPR
jgi:hypothetical protein